MLRPRLIVFASGSKTGGGSGFENLVLASRTGALLADILAVVSNHETGGVRTRANRLEIPFVHFPSPYTAPQYQAIVKQFNANFAALSGWLKLVSGLEAKTTFNIHPGPLPQFGGKGMYGHHVHEAVLANYRRNKLACESAVSMHFVTKEYDQGPVFFHFPVGILPGDSAESIGARVNATEHLWQAKITNLVVQGKISWDGKDPASLQVPKDYQFLPKK